MTEAALRHQSRKRIIERRSFSISNRNTAHHKQRPRPEIRQREAELTDLRKMHRRDRETRSERLMCHDHIRVNHKGSQICTKNHKQRQREKIESHSKSIPSKGWQSYSFVFPSVVTMLDDRYSSGLCSPRSGGGRVQTKKEKDLPTQDRRHSLLIQCLRPPMY